jgi:hypothetical protein
MLMSNEPKSNIELDFFDGTQLIYSRSAQTIDIRFPNRSLFLRLNYDLTQVHKSHLTSIARMKESDIIAMDDHQTGLIEYHVVPWIITHLKACLEACLSEQQEEVIHLDGVATLAISNALEKLNVSTSSEDSLSSLNITTSSCESTTPPSPQSDLLWTKLSTKRRTDISFSRRTS